MQGGAFAWASFALALGIFSGMALVPSPGPPTAPAEPSLADAPPAPPPPAPDQTFDVTPPPASGPMDAPGVQMWRILQGDAAMHVHVGAAAASQRRADNGSEAAQTDVVSPDGRAVLTCKKGPCDLVIPQPAPGLWWVRGLRGELRIDWASPPGAEQGPLYQSQRTQMGTSTDEFHVPANLTAMVFRARPSELPFSTLGTVLPAMDLVAPDGSRLTCVAPCAIRIEHPLPGAWQARYALGVPLAVSVVPGDA